MCDPRDREEEEYEANKELADDIEDSMYGDLDMDDDPVDQDGEGDG